MRQCGHLLSLLTLVGIALVWGSPLFAQYLPGWGIAGGHSGPNISPNQPLVNPWFKTGDFQPSEEEYAPPPSEEVSTLASNISDPTFVWVERVKKDGETITANFKAMQVDGRIYVPVIVLPHLFETKVRWKAKERRLFIYRGASSLSFSLDCGLEVQFFDTKVDLHARLIYYDSMLFVPIRTLSDFFKKKVYWAPSRKLMSFLPKTAKTDSFQKSWEKVLSRYGADKYAKKLQSTTPASVGHEGQVFLKIWGTSEEPQRLACKGLRGDWYLKADDMGIALPSRKTLMRKVQIRHRKTGKVATATVVDVGPWNIDDPYWLKTGGRPEVETTVYDRRGRKSNLAGIDLSFAVWYVLGVDKATAYGGNYSAYVDWWFID